MGFIQIKVTVLFVDLSSFGIAQQVDLIALSLKYFYKMAPNNRPIVSEKRKPQQQFRTIVKGMIYNHSRIFKSKDAVTLRGLRASECTSDEKGRFELLEKNIVCSLLE